MDAITYENRGFSPNLGSGAGQMKADCLNIDGRFYPLSDRRWGNSAEELLRYTSRYYTYTQSLLRNLSESPEFNMAGYQAAGLSMAQRALMAQMLALPPVQEVARDVIVLVRSRILGEAEPSAELIERYPIVPVQPKQPVLVYADRPHEPRADGASPLDPFINLAARLHLPYEVDGRHLRVPFRLLVKHLDSNNAQIRENLRDAVLHLHEGGYVLSSDGEAGEDDESSAPGT